MKKETLEEIEKTIVNICEKVEGSDPESLNYAENAKALAMLINARTQAEFNSVIRLNQARWKSRKTY